jgi:TonB family protein
MMAIGHASVQPVKSLIHPRFRRGMPWHVGWNGGLGLAACFILAALTANGRAAEPASPRVSAERAGALPTHDALELTFTADLGNVRVFNDAAGEVRYHVTLEAEAADPAAQTRLKQFSLTARNTPMGIILEGRMPQRGDTHNVWVSYELHVPRRYNLRISTQAGNIMVADMEGQVILVSGGGNIEAGRIGDFDSLRSDTDSRGGSVARLETAGGHITVGDVTGALRAITGGGHISTGDIFGDATLQTAGGHIRARRVAGTARLFSGGGNIYAQRAEHGLFAETAGGRIELVEGMGEVGTRIFRGSQTLRRGNQMLQRGEMMARTRQDDPPPEISDGVSPAGTWDIPANGRIADWTRRMESLWRGGVRADPADQQKRLLQSPAPEYPEVARRAGIEGQVTLGVRIGVDGSVEDVRLLSGEPVLGRAAMEAVEQWRYAPLRIGGRPVSILTSVTLAFELR